MIGALIGLGTSLLGNSGGGSSVSQQPLTTPEQEAAIKALKSYYETGKIGGSDMKAGEAYGGSLGNYQTTGVENTGLSALQQMLNGGLGTNFTNASNALNEMSNAKYYDPNASGGVYQTFKKEALKNQADQSNILNRNMAATGSLYSTNQGVQQRRLGENTNDSLQSKLAEMAQLAITNRMNAANSGVAAANTGQNMLMNQIGASQQYGGLARTLQNEEANNKYSAWLNQRTEQQNQIQNMLNAMQNNAKGVEWGVKNASMPNNSGISSLLSTAGNLVGNGSFNGLFGSSGSGTSTGNLWNTNSNLNYASNPYISPLKIG